MLVTDLKVCHNINPTLLRLSDMEALAEKYLADGITIVAEDRNHDIVTMWGPNMMDDYDDEGHILRREFDSKGNIVDMDGNIIERNEDNDEK